MTTTAEVPKPPTPTGNSKICGGIDDAFWKKAEPVHLNNIFLFLRLYSNYMAEIRHINYAYLLQNIANNEKLMYFCC